MKVTAKINKKTFSALKGEQKRRVIIQNLAKEIASKLYHSKEYLVTFNEERNYYEYEIDIVSRTKEKTEFEEMVRSIPIDKEHELKQIPKKFYYLFWDKYVEGPFLDPHFRAEVNTDKGTFKLRKYEKNGNYTNANTD